MDTTCKTLSHDSQGDFQVFYHVTNLEQSTPFLTNVLHN